jgi:hypothetical protein
LLLALVLSLAGCWDFADPEFPEAGAPAVLQTTAVVNENGSLTFDALLAPGLSIGGVTRKVPRDTLDVYNLELGPTAIGVHGKRTYKFSDKVKLPNIVTLPFEVMGPVVEGITGPPPRVQWFGYQKTDPDTVTLPRNADLLLHVQAVPGVSTPAPGVRQWFLEVRGSSRSFRISADSLPPSVLRVLADQVPASDGDTLHVFFSFFQTGQQHSPSNDYIGNFALTHLLHWFVRIQ